MRIARIASRTTQAHERMVEKRQDMTRLEIRGRSIGGEAGQNPEARVAQGRSGGIVHRYAPPLQFRPHPRS